MSKLSATLTSSVVSGITPSGVSTETTSRIRWARVSLLALYVVAVVLAFYFRVELSALVESAALSRAWTSNVVAALSVAIVVALALPAGATYVACGAILGATHGAAISIFGALVGSTMMYAAARPFRKEARALFPIERSTLDRIERAIDARGTRLVTWLRLSPFVPVSVVNVSSAILGVRWRAFLTALPASAISATAFALSGAIGEAALAGELGWTELISGGLVLSSSLGMMFAASSVRRAMSDVDASSVDAEDTAGEAWPGADTNADADADARTIGVELEFVAMDVNDAARIVADVFEGTVIDGDSPVESAVETPMGTFVVERDSAPYKRAAARAEARRSDRSGGVDSESLRDDALLHLGKPFVPTEVVSPPMTLRELPQIDVLVDALRAEGAKGTGRSPIDALGLHLNPEALDASAAGILATLRAYFLLHDYLRKSAEIDFARRASGYITPHGSEYRDLVLNPDYAPDLDVLVGDYIRIVGTRNRDLDMLPLFAHLRPRAAEALGDDRVKARPTYHYRLPNCAIDEEGWSVRMEWERWRLVEELAEERETLAVWLRAEGAPESAVAEARVWAESRVAEREASS